MEYEIWVTHSGSPCAVCASYAGRTWPVGVGPQHAELVRIQPAELFRIQPVVDTHEFCRCTREPAESTVLPSWGSSMDLTAKKGTVGADDGRV